jgi:hypothetical protein
MLAIRPMALSVFCLSIALSTPARAWDVTGHMAVAWIAAQELRDPAQQQRFISLLEQHPAFRDTSYRLNWQRNIPKNLSKQQYFAYLLMQAAEWPDSLRDRTAKLADPDTGKLIPLEADAHYINLPLGDSRHFPQSPEGHILQKMQRCLDTLRTPSSTPSQRAQALAWFSHLLGDLHQPLHCVAYYSPFLPRGDSGGNSVLASPKPITMSPPVSASATFPSLHHFWDEVLGTSNKFQDITVLGQSLMQQYPRSQFAADFQAVTFENWAEEGRALADNYAYRLAGQAVDCLAKSDVENRLKRNEAVQIPVLPANYVSLARQIAERRVTLAGYRLADQLMQLPAN